MLFFRFSGARAHRRQWSAATGAVRCGTLSGIFSLRLDIGDDVFRGHTREKLFALFGVVPRTGSELAQESNRVDDTDLSDENICYVLRNSRDIVP